MRNSKIIFRLIVNLTADKGFQTSKIEYQCSEKNLIYSATRTFENEIIKRNIKKDAIMIPDATTILNDDRRQSYVVWCFDDQLEEAEEKLKSLIIRDVKRMKENVDSLFEHTITKHGLRIN